MSRSTRKYEFRPYIRYTILNPLNDERNKSVTETAETKHDGQQRREEKIKIRNILVRHKIEYINIRCVVGGCKCDMTNFTKIVVHSSNAMNFDKWWNHQR